jgi:hypothetical protein
MALLPVVYPEHKGDLMDREVMSEAFFSALVSLLHICYESGVDLDRELNAARDLFMSDLEEDAAMCREGDE